MAYIYLDEVEGKIVHRKCDGKAFKDTPAKVVMSPTIITIGCSSISLKAARWLLEKHEFEFPTNQKLIQDGSTFQG